MNKKVLIFLIIALILGLGIGIGGTVLAQKTIFKTQNTAAGVSQPKQTGPLLSLGEVLINLQGGAILRTTITLEVTDDKALTQLKADTAILSDKVNSVLLNRPLADVQTPENLAKLKAELLKKLNEVADNKITDVFFEKIVYQQ
ncbi:flagellar basal body-associated protein [Desulfosporosinus acidiphilus SJ4]|uniref:Flagellar protein FliL n=1 Tax=Desulfosporosinus acidiphilus (strain DSM 22704 / JCM 16185 / SJ4) TaxID=646529 RepID=I4DA78_DESAJ|nr:flagellar basal body-associated FliL family protein [Desulfosporosinus acidiphilus]AFM42702.1 flagellar basal body-associated protein [Desulfosporosinus acidiphilus SJ4]